MLDIASCSSKSPLLTSEKVSPFEIYTPSAKNFNSKQFGKPINRLVDQTAATGCMTPSLGESLGFSYIPSNYSIFSIGSSQRWQTPTYNK